MVSKNLAIMFTDMEGFTSRTSKNSRRQVEKLINLQDEVVLPVIERFGGNLIKTIGDSYMVTFESPTSAVLCGLKIQEAVAAVAGKFELKIAINTGDVNVKKGDVFGEPVNVAARLETIARPKEVFITEAVYLAMNKNDIPTTMVGPKHFKGIPYPVNIYRVLTKRDMLTEAGSALARNYKKVIIPVIALALLSVFGFWSYNLWKINLEAMDKGEVGGMSSSFSSTPSPTPIPTESPKPTNKSETPSPTPVPTQDPTPAARKGKRFK